MKKLLFAATVALMAFSAAQAQEEADFDVVEVVEVEGFDSVPAPNFTLKDLRGKEVSLSDFKGKWVVLDFWGSWCKWCVIGIPEMKKAYEKYHPKGLEIIGIDCNEPQEAWREAVERYELPWVHLYNPDGRGKGITAEYEIQGYPTKVIVDPDGFIYDIVIGEDPVFYEILSAIPF